MPSLLQIIVDFLFPPSKEEMQLRELLPEGFFGLAGKAGSAEFPFIQSIFSYKDQLVRELVWQIKYKKNKKAVECAGYALYQELSRQDMSSIVLIPIPISKKRRRERGYNQSELIIEEICRLNTGVRKHFDLLVRTKDIEKQTFKNREERISNTQHIFEVTRPPKDACKIIIVDDVSTTGSTLREAREALLKAGYKDVSALTIAH